jgi:hypothetical protein
MNGVKVNAVISTVWLSTQPSTFSSILLHYSPTSHFTTLPITTRQQQVYTHYQVDCYHINQHHRSTHTEPEWLHHPGMSSYLVNNEGREAGYWAKTSMHGYTTTQGVMKTANPLRGPAPPQDDYRIGLTAPPKDNRPQTEVSIILDDTGYD